MSDPTIDDAMRITLGVLDDAASLDNLTPAQYREFLEQMADEIQSRLEAALGEE